LIDAERARGSIKWSSKLERDPRGPGPFIEDVEPADSGGALAAGWTGGDVLKPDMNTVFGDVLSDGEGTDPPLIGGRGGSAREGLEGVSRSTGRGSKRGPGDSVGLVNARRWRSVCGGGMGGMAAVPNGEGMLARTGTLGSGPGRRGTLGTEPGLGRTALKLLLAGADIPSGVCPAGGVGVDPPWMETTGE
jgi:hypothetical protein